MFKLYNICFIALFFVELTLTLPIQKPKKVKVDENDLEYERYLKEVVEVLESDPEFRKKINDASETDIRNGKIAQELEYVSHHVRTKLDEIKREELERLRTLAKKQFELSNQIDTNLPEHIDHKNENTFEIKDLEKLISQASKDLAQVDKKRREEFKEYEMQKEFEKQSVLNELDEDSKRRYEEELKQDKDKHNKHEKVHHPGNKAQLEEVWEKQDHMEEMDFDPKTFFMMHDIDGNGFWDETELKTLFVKELDKVYNSGAPEDDIKERAEEMERMREHVFEESDTNRDGLISYEEFLIQTKQADFQTDPEWETVDKQPQFTNEEYLEFEKKRQAEIQNLIAKNELPSHPKIPEGYNSRLDKSSEQKQQQQQQQHPESLQQLQEQYPQPSPQIQQPLQHQPQYQQYQQHMQNLQQH